jgi:hypothetical protein
MHETESYTVTGIAGGLKVCAEISVKTQVGSLILLASLRN